MNKALPISRLIKVDVNLAPNAAQAQDISTLLILGTSGIIDTNERMRDYFSIDAVAADFGTTAPEYLAAVLWFEQSPQPASLKIGCWAKTGTTGMLTGEALTITEQILSNFISITNGYLSVAIDGVTYNATGINFSSVTNLNGVAAQVALALIAVGMPAEVGNNFIWDAVNSKFVFTSGSTGALSSVDYFKTVSDFVELGYNIQPASSGGAFFIGPGNTNAVSFYPSETPTNALPPDNYVIIGINVNATVANILNFLKQGVGSAPANASTLAELAKATFDFSPTSNLIIRAYAINFDIPFRIHNGFGTINDTITGGYSTAPIGNNLYGLFKNTKTNLGARKIQGIDAETAINSIDVFDNTFGQSFYGLTILGATNAEHLAVANYIEAANNKHVYAVSTTDITTLDKNITTDISSQLKALNLKRTLTQYSSTNSYSAVSLLARILTTNYNANNTVITLMYKQEPGIVAEKLSASEINALEGKNCNVFVAYNNNTAIVEQGRMSNGYFIDEVTGTDWLALTIQTEIFNALYTSTTKIPQTDSGVHTLLTVAESVCAQGVINGLLAPGVWNTQGFGALNQGDYLPKGFYVYAASVNTQLSADRAARKSPPIQVAAKLAGAIHTVDVIINVNR